MNNTGKATEAINNLLKMGRFLPQGAIIEEGDLWIDSGVKGCHKTRRARGNVSDGLYFVPIKTRRPSQKTSPSIHAYPVHTLNQIDRRIKMNRKPAMRLWKYNKITGFWNVARVVTADTASSWLTIWQKDEPKETFVISTRRPPSPKPFRG